MCAGVQLPVEHLSTAPGHSQALDGAGWWGRGERGFSSGADCCSKLPALYWNKKLKAYWGSHPIITALLQQFKVSNTICLDHITFSIVYFAEIA